MDESQIVHEVAKVVPPAWQHYTTMITLAVMIVVRMLHNMANGGTWSSALYAVFAGSNTPSTKDSTTKPVVTDSSPK